LVYPFVPVKELKALLIVTTSDPSNEVVGVPVLPGIVTAVSVFGSVDLYETWLGKVMMIYPSFGIAFFGLIKNV
jgi:hypothetical protein